MASDKENSQLDDALDSGDLDLIATALQSNSPESAAWSLAVDSLLKEKRDNPPIAQHLKRFLASLPKPRTISRYERAVQFIRSRSLHVALSISAMMIVGGSAYITSLQARIKEATQAITSLEKAGFLRPIRFDCIGGEPVCHVVSNSEIQISGQADPEIVRGISIDFDDGTEPVEIAILLDEKSPRSSPFIRKHAYRLNGAVVRPIVKVRFHQGEAERVVSSLSVARTYQGGVFFLSPIGITVGQPSGLFAERAVSIWLIGKGGEIEPKGKSGVRISSIDKLPSDDFRVYGASSKNSKNFTDDDLAKLEPLSSLQHLDISNSSITANAVDLLVRHRSLAALALGDIATVDDKFIAKLAQLPLTDLEIQGTAISDQAFKSLEQMISVKFLDLRNTKVSAESVRDFKAKRPDVNVRH